MVTPPDTRPQEPTVADEHTMLEGFLDLHRATLRWKCDGLDAEQLRRRSVEPSSMSLLGLVRHMTEVELSWFVRRFRGEQLAPVYYSDDNPDGDFDDVDQADVAEAFSRYEAAIARCKEAAAGASLDDTFVHSRNGNTYQLRWLYLHMLEEYARHNGHADLLRERIDGATGE